mmetsp:Transcript_11786/g.28132  ORF Transcript_11786/g.28132 Transcript_11786/m.28132 type:complete len:88 (-) Transcript_11786:66-329(-)
MPFSAIVADQAAAGKKEAQFTQLWSMQGLGAATSPAAVSSTSFYASSGPGSTPGGYVLPSNRKKMNSHLGQAMSIFDSSFKSQPSHQ